MKTITILCLYIINLYSNNLEQYIVKSHSKHLSKMYSIDKFYSQSMYKEPEINNYEKHDTLPSLPQENILKDRGIDIQIKKRSEEDKTKYNYQNSKETKKYKELTKPPVNNEEEHSLDINIDLNKFLEN